MNQDAVIYTRGTTHHKGDAIMETPTRDSGDVGVAYGAEPTLVMPEKAKCSSTPKRFRHMIPFAFLEVGFIGRVVRVGFALDLNMSLNGRATSEEQSHLCGMPSSSYDSPKNVQSLCPCCSKYFCLSQPGYFLWCLRRAHCHRLMKIARSTRRKTRLLTTCR